MRFGRGIALALAFLTAGCDDDDPVTLDVAVVEPQIQLSFTGTDGTLNIHFGIELHLPDDAAVSSGITTRNMAIKTADGSELIVDGIQKPATTELSVSPGATTVAPFDIELGYSGAGIDMPADTPLCQRAPVVVSVEYTHGVEVHEALSDPITPGGC